MSDTDKSRRNTNTAILLALISALATIGAAYISSRFSDPTPIHSVVVQDVVSRRQPVAHTTNATVVAGQPSVERKDCLEFQTSDVALENYLTGIAGAIEQHDWESLLAYFGEDNYLEQRDIVFEGDLPMQQYLEEGLGLGYADNYLPRVASDFPFARLNKIHSIRFTEMNTVTDQDGDRRNHIIEVQGSVRLDDESQRDAMLYIRRKVTGGFVVEPPLG